MLLTPKDYRDTSIFKPENLLREARRQKGLNDCPIPQICLLDPDGDMVDYLIRKGASLNPCWSCYHTKMYEFDLNGMGVGIIGCAVGASFAVLLAEQMFVSGCQLLISMTSAGIVGQADQQARFLLITEALRDEGTSYHYLPPETPALLNPLLEEKLQNLLQQPELGIKAGISWTTDAPYRETASAITQAKARGAQAVEMEASALYAFAQMRHKQVVCYAYLTNTMAQEGEDFEKGLENGSVESLKVIEETIRCLI